MSEESTSLSIITLNINGLNFLHSKGIDWQKGFKEKHDPIISYIQESHFICKNKNG